MSEPQVTHMGVFDAQVCVPSEWTDGQIEAFAESECPCGTRKGWTIRRAGGKEPESYPERNPCAERSGYVHVMLDA